MKIECKMHTLGSMVHGWKFCASTIDVNLPVHFVIGSCFYSSKLWLVAVLFKIVACFLCRSCRRTKSIGFGDMCMMVNNQWASFSVVKQEAGACIKRNIPPKTLSSRRLFNLYVELFICLCNDDKMNVGYLLWLPLVNRQSIPSSVPTSCRGNG